LWSTPSVSKQKLRFTKYVGLRSFFCFFSTRLCALYSSHQALSGELGVPIKNFKKIKK
jgi:hypothetical protein